MEMTSMDLSFHYGFDCERFMPPKSGGDLFHYTSFDALKSILLGRKESIVFWATRSDSFKDKEEGKLAIQRYHEACTGLKKDLGEKLYQFFSGIKPDENCLFDYREDANSTIYERKKCNWYVISFTTDSNSQYMWENYGQVNLEIYLDDIGILAGNGCVASVCPVCYCEEEQISLIRSFIKRLVEDYEGKPDEAIIGHVQTQLNRWKMVFKRPEFAKEKEVRVILCVEEEQANVRQKVYPKNVAGEKDRYYYEFELPKERYGGINVLHPPGLIGEIKDEYPGTPVVIV